MHQMSNVLKEEQKRELKSPFYPFLAGIYVHTPLLARWPLTNSSPVGFQLCIDRPSWFTWVSKHAKRAWHWGSEVTPEGCRGKGASAHTLVLSLHLSWLSAFPTFTHGSFCSFSLSELHNLCKSWLYFNCQLIIIHIYLVRVCIVIPQWSNNFN